MTIITDEKEVKVSISTGTSEEKEKGEKKFTFMKVWNYIAKPIINIPRKSDCGDFLFNQALQFNWIHAHVPDGIDIDGIRIFVVVMYQLEWLHDGCTMIDLGPILQLNYTWVRQWLYG